MVRAQVEEPNNLIEQAFVSNCMGFFGGICAPWAVPLFSWWVSEMAERCGDGTPVLCYSLRELVKNIVPALFENNSPLVDEQADD